MRPLRVSMTTRPGGRQAHRVPRYRSLIPGGQSGTGRYPLPRAAPAAGRAQEARPVPHRYREPPPPPARLSRSANRKSAPRHAARPPALTPRRPIGEPLLLPARDARRADWSIPPPVRPLARPRAALRPPPRPFAPALPAAADPPPPRDARRSLAGKRHVLSARAGRRPRPPGLPGPLRPAPRCACAGEGGVRTCARAADRKGGKRARKGAKKAAMGEDEAPF